MAKTLDFNKVKKQYFTITLNDDNQTKLQVMTPLKKQVAELTELLPDDADNPSDDDLSALFDLAARLMSRNRQNYKIEASLLEDILDYEDLCIFFDTFTDFIVEVTDSKN